MYNRLLFKYRENIPATCPMEEKKTSLCFSSKKQVETVVPSNNKISIAFCSHLLPVPQNLFHCRSNLLTRFDETAKSLQYP